MFREIKHLIHFVNVKTHTHILPASIKLVMLNLCRQQSSWKLGWKSGIGMLFSLLHVALASCALILCVYAFIHEPPDLRADCSLNSVSWVLDVFRVKYIIDFQVSSPNSHESVEFLEKGW